MSATTAPTEDKVADATESFIKVIGRKIRAGATRTKLFFQKSWKGAKHNTVRGAKATGRGLKLGGYRLAYGVTWALMAVGTVVFTVFRWAGIIVIKTLDVILLVLVTILTVLAFLLEHAIYFVVRLALFVGLLLSTPFHWVRDLSNDGVKADWELFLIGLKPRNWKYMTLGTIAAATMAPSKTAPSRRTAGSNGQGSRPAAAKRATQRTAGKGRPTPRRSTRRSVKLPRAGVRAATA